jgi:hypothetical protein
MSRISWSRNGVASSAGRPLALNSSFSSTTADRATTAWIASLNSRKAIR